MTISKNPVTGNYQLILIPKSVENFLGKIMYPVLCNSHGGTVSKTDRVFGHYVAMVEKVGSILTEHSPRKKVPFEFKVVDSKDHNAWCLPGGKIAISLGLILAMDREGATYGLNRHFTLEEKIASVLSHEMTHATAYHAVRNAQFSLLLILIIKVMESVLQFFLGFVAGESLRVLSDRLIAIIAQGAISHRGRSYEFEADKYGMHLVYEAGKAKHCPQDAALARVWLQKFCVDHHNSRTGVWIVDRWRELWASHPTPQGRCTANIHTWHALTLPARKAAQGG